jgi:hypothetical protein
MKMQILSFVRDVKANKKLPAFDEASIKQAVVLRLLSLLGWDIFNVDEVSPDFATDSDRVSYALCMGGAKKVFLEVTRPHESLDERHKQLVAFAGREHVELAVHTNGLHWWFYLPSLKGALNQKCCHVLDLSEQKLEDVASDLIAFLSRDNVLNDAYLQSAKTAYQIQKRKLAAEVLPEAWNMVLAEPNKILVEILSDATEKLCGCKPEPGIIEDFIRSNLERWALSPAKRSAPTPSEHARPSAGQTFAWVAENSSGIGTKKPEFFADKSIRSFSFQGNTVTVKAWEDMLTALCNMFAKAHPQEFEKVLWLYDDQKPCFSRYSEQLKFPEKIKKTNIFVETKLAPEEVVKTVGDLLTEFGYGHDELVITTQ